MKKLLCAALCLCLVFAIVSAPAEPDEAQSLKQKYEKDVAYNAVQTLCRVGCDDLNRWGTDRVVKRSSPAWEIITRFDGGWFSTVRSSSYLDWRSENWKKTGDKTFECDVYCVNRIVFAIENTTVDFPCGYHLCFEQTDARKDTWLLYDFDNLPVEQRSARAEYFTSLDEGIRVEAVAGKSFRGFMMVIDDPARVFVGTTNEFNSHMGGWRVDQLAKKYDALAVINGGAFEDAGGGGNGAIPSGYVVSQGTQKSYNAYNNAGCNVVMGFDAENKLHVGKYTNDELARMQLRDAIAFNMILIADGKKSGISEKNMSYSARSAIGQDADGRVLLLVVEGRQPGSFGASFTDLQDVMLSYGAVNAGNLDGGHSSAMYMHSESVYSAYPLAVSRRMPAAFIVK